MSPVPVSQAIAMLLAGGQGVRLYPLTRDRAKPAVPFGGKYRIIDFTLSNCINSGVRRIQVLSQYKSISLANHIRDGWSFLHPELGEFISLVPPQMRVSDDWYRGTADAIYQNIYSIERLRPLYTLILAGDHIYKMDYGKMLDFHVAMGADATVSTIAVPREAAAEQLGVIEVDPRGRIVGFEEKPADPRPIPGLPEMAYASMGVYVFTTSAMIPILEEDSTREDSTHDFGRDIIPRACKTHRLVAYPFGANEVLPDRKYWRDIGTLDAYWEANMDLASVTPSFNLYDPEWPIRTYEGQHPPAKTVFADEEHSRMGVAMDSLLCGGVIISGGRVVRSVLSPEVRVNSFSEVVESVLLHGVEVGRTARVHRAIVDKDVKIPPGESIGYDLERDRERFVVSEGGIVVVPRGMVIE